MDVVTSRFPLVGRKTQPYQDFPTQHQEARTKPPIDRLYHFDAVRSFCLIYGFFLHAATTDVTGQLSLVGKVSDLFRMAAFFLVAGFFGAMLMRRMSVAAFLRKRSLSLLVPLATGLLLLNTVTVYLIYVYHAGYAHPMDLLQGEPLKEVTGPLPTHLRHWFFLSLILHLWFLIALIVYVLLTPLFGAIASLPVFGRILSALGDVRGDVLLIVLAACAGVGVAAARGFFDVALEPVLGETPLSWVARITFNYMPFYFIGVLTFAYAPVYRALHRPGLPALAAGALVFAVLVVWLDGEHDSGAAKIAYYVAKNFVILIVVAVLLAIGEALFCRELPVISYLSERIYTGYILHFAIIYVLALGLRPLGLPPTVQYMGIAFGALAIAFWLHGRVIARSPLLQLLFNGKPLDRRGKPVRRPASAATVA